MLACGAEYLAAASNEHDRRCDVEVWNLASGELCHTYRRQFAYGARSLAFTPDGRFLLVSEGLGVRVIETGWWELRSGPPPKLWCATFALNAAGDRLLVAEFANQQRRLTLWHVSNGPTYRQAWAVGKTSPDFSSPAVTPDGRRAAAVERSGYDRPKQFIRIRDAADGQVLVEIAHDAADAIQQLAFTADGSRLLARCHGRTILAFDAVTGDRIGELVHTGRPFVTGVAVHPDAQVIAAIRNDGTVWFWDPATLRHVRTFDWKLGNLLSVAFSPDGSLAAAGTEDGRVILWDVDL